MPGVHDPIAAVMALFPWDLVLPAILIVVVSLGIMVVWGLVWGWPGKFNAGQRAFEAGRYAEAEQYLIEALHLLEGKCRDHALRIVTLDLLGRVYLARGEFDEAEELLQESLTVLRATRAPHRPELDRALNSLGMVLKERGRLAEAEEHYRQALAVWEAAKGRDADPVGIAMNNLGVLYQEQARYADAEPFLQRALAIRERRRGVMHPEDALAVQPALLAGGGLIGRFTRKLAPLHPAAARLCHFAPARDFLSGRLCGYNVATRCSGFSRRDRSWVSTTANTTAARDPVSWAPSLAAARCAAG